MDKGGQSLLSFPVWHGKGQEVNKLKSYAVNQLKVTRNTFRDPIIAAVTVSMIAVLLIFVVWPLLEVVKQSLVDTAGNYSFQAYKNIFTMRETYKAFCNTIMLAVIVGVLATVIGFLFAYCTSHLQLRGKRIFNLMAMMPMVSPPFSVAMSIIMLFGSRGLITYRLLGWTNTNIYWLKGLIFVQTISYFPIAFLLLAGMLRSIDSSIEDAARDLGSSKWRTFSTITVPLVRPGIANAFLLVFSCSLADFATPQVLGGHSFPVLPTQAYLQITGMYDFKGGAALSFMLLIPALVVYALQHYWVSKKSYVTVSGKAGGKSSIKGPGLVLTGIMGSVVAIVIAFIIAIYAVILVGSLVKIWGVNNTITFDNYQYVLTHGMKAIKDTLIIACIGTPLGGLLAVLVGYVTTRLKIRGHKTLETVSLLNHTLPGTVVGIAYIIAFNDKPIILTGTIYILIAAYLFRYSSAGIRNVIAALTQIDPSIEEASRSLGAGSARTFISITIPLVLPAILAGMKYLFIHSMTAISATIFLVSVNWTLITTRILECMTELQFAQACAFSVILILLVFAASGAMTLLAKVLCRNGDNIGA